jgi:hypothetical protein
LRQEVTGVRWEPANVKIEWSTQPPTGRLDRPNQLEVLKQDVAVVPISSPQDLRPDRERARIVGAEAPVQQ